MMAPGWRGAAYWIALAIVGALLLGFVFQAYLNPAALIDFANSKLC